MFFQDRAEAGKQLAARLIQFKGQDNTIVVGMARGGVAVAEPIAQALHCPLAVLVVKKLGAPGNEELALGAVAEDGQMFLNESLISMLDISKDYIQKERVKMKAQAEEKSKVYLDGKKPINYAQKNVILVDDGIATGASVRAAIKMLKSQKAATIFLAVPVGSRDSLEILSREVDELICLYTPAYFEAVGQFYEKFEQVTDQEVLNLLSRNG